MISNQVMPKLNRTSLRFIVACFMALGGCVYDADKDPHRELSPDHATGDNGLPHDDRDPRALRIRASRAYAAGLAAITQEPISAVGDAWVLREICMLAPDRALQQYLNDSAVNYVDDPFLRLIDPCAPLIELPVDPGTGLNRFYNYMLAPFGTPRERAMAFIHDFMTLNASGYILTHQFLLLQWAEQIGFELPEHLVIMRHERLEQILQEQLRNDSFSDLYAERVALLLHFGNQNPENATKWVKTIVDAQLQDGSWGSYSETIAFDDQSVTWEPGVSHISALALLSLRTYLDRYQESP